MKPSSTGNSAEGPKPAQPRSLTWWRVARRPKWLAGLAVALLAAASFVLLSQWQLERSFNTVGQQDLGLEAVELSTLIAPGDPIPTAILDRLATAAVTLDTGNVFIVGNRLQLQADGSTEPGYWVIANSRALVGEEIFSLTLALGFTADLDAARQVKLELEDSLQAQAFMPVTGLVEPTEGPVENPEPGVLGSLSVAQLVNLYSQEPIIAYPVYLIVTEGPLQQQLQPIVIDILEQRVEVNWLTAFYAAEWIVFAGFAFYIWWRLVMDARNRERSEALGEPRIN